MIDELQKGLKGIKSRRATEIVGVNRELFKYGGMCLYKSILHVQYVLETL
jgi:hypothetical protein